VAYPWFKTFHLVGMVAWFAGVFYLPRLFVYHAEAASRAEAERAVLHAQFSRMERLLYRAITVPAMVFTLAMATGMIVLEPSLLLQGWLEAKLGFVFVLVVYTLWQGELMRELAEGTCRFSSQTFRVLNEIPTVLLIAIVVLAVFRGEMTGVVLGATLGAVTLLLALGILAYARLRRPT
jgi:putative membrane protein